ncbi:hypothetical protein TNIN_418781 [Trichonephila inaurata madagascariensis]|uniref:sn-1-specific diacylglycerol lipase ABHD11 n=1 Tax=Trichonephila inaurata madagascariensis TaxID=2747483 RepID=A0A8X6YMG9_9ARAC|nr:hypothetical protein TNIN_418781 [Trichonephila inaurata madagascariensis]
MEPIDMAYDFYEAPDSSADLPPIILIHGIVWNKYMFRELAEKLCLATNRKVYSLDLRNHGESPFCEKCTMFEMCEDVKYFIKVNEFQKISFVCHSFSTTIAYMVALEKPEVVEKMVMVDSFPFNSFEKDLKDGYIPEVFFQNRILKTLSPKWSLKEAREKLRKLAEKESRSQKLLYKKMIHDLKKEDGQFKWKTDIDFLQKRVELKEHMVPPRGRCNHEILFVRCPNSINVTDERFEKVLKYNPNSKLVTIEDTSHLLLLEKTDEFVEVVSEFLSDQRYEVQDRNFGYYVLSSPSSCANDEASVSILIKLRKTSQTHDVHLQWIPSHVNIGGNKMINRLAKELGEYMKTLLLVSSLRRDLYFDFMIQYQLISVRGIWSNKDYYPDFMIFIVENIDSHRKKTKTTLQIKMEPIDMAYDFYEAPDSSASLPPIILLHGFVWNKYMFRELADKLCLATNRKVYCPDLRNHGESPSSEKCTMSAMSEDVKNFIKVNELQKVSFVCHSFSSTIAYLVALEKQKLFYKKVIHDLKKEDGEFKWKTDIDFLQKRIDTKDLFVSPRGRCNHEILFVRCPNSINVTDERFEKVLKYNPNSKLVTIEDSSHLLLLEKIDEFVEVVSEFLSDRRHE